VEDIYKWIVTRFFNLKYYWKRTWWIIEEGMRKIRVEIDYRVHFENLI